MSEGKSREALQETSLRGEHHGILNHLVKPLLPKNLRKCRTNASREEN